MSLVALAGAAIALLFTFGLNAIWRPKVTDELKDLASSSGRALGTVYALILALAFNTVMSEHREL